MSAASPPPSPSSSPPSSRRKPKGQGASRRGEILSAATLIFLKEGVAHATMRRIATAVGVSPTALYVYFPDKDAILLAIAEATFAELLATLQASQRESEKEPTPEHFRAGMRAYVDFGLAHPDAYRLTFMPYAARTKPEACHEIPAADQSFDLLRDHVERMMAAGFFRAGSPQLVAEAFWACMHGITTLLIDQPDHLETPPERLIDQVIDMIIAGSR